VTDIETPYEEFVVCPSGPVPLGLSNKGEKCGLGSIMNGRNEKCIQSFHRKILTEYKRPRLYGNIILKPFLNAMKGFAWTILVQYTSDRRDILITTPNNSHKTTDIFTNVKITLCTHNVS